MPADDDLIVALRTQAHNLRTPRFRARATGYALIQCAELLERAVRVTVDESHRAGVAERRTLAVLEMQEQASESLQRAMDLLREAISMTEPEEREAAVRAERLRSLAEFKEQAAQMLREEEQQQAETERELAQASDMLLRVADNLSRG